MNDTTPSNWASVLFPGTWGHMGTVLCLIIKSFGVCVRAVDFDPLHEMVGRGRGGVGWGGGHPRYFHLSAPAARYVSQVGLAH